MVLHIYSILILRILSNHGTRPILSTLHLYDKVQIQHILQHLNMQLFLYMEYLSYYGYIINTCLQPSFQKSLMLYVSSFQFQPFHCTQYFLNIFLVPYIKYMCWTRLFPSMPEFPDKAQNLDNFLLLRCFLSQSTRS